MGSTITSSNTGWYNPADVTNAEYDEGTFAQKVTLATKLAGEDQTADVIKTEQRFSFSTISTAATTVVKSGSGFLHRIIVTGGTAGTIIAYDNTAGSGTQIANFDSTNAIQSYEVNATTSIGITVVTGAATKITVVYR